MEIARTAATAFVLLPKGCIPPLDQYAAKYRQQFEQTQPAYHLHNSFRRRPSHAGAEVWIHAGSIMHFRTNKQETAKMIVTDCEINKNDILF